MAAAGVVARIFSKFGIKAGSKPVANVANKLIAKGGLFAGAAAATYAGLSGVVSKFSDILGVDDSTGTVILLAIASVCIVGLVMLYRRS